MGMMGTLSTGASRSCAPKTLRGGPSVAQENDDVQKMKDIGNGEKINCESGELNQSEADDVPGCVPECVPDRWGSRALMQRTDVEEKSAPILTLPDDVMTLVFARLPRHSLVMARVVCSSWKRVAEQQELATLRRKIGVTEGWIYILAEKPEGTPFRAYDPIAAKWFVLPPTPGLSEAGHQWQGFACVALGHRVLLIGGTRSQMSPTSAQYSAAVVCSDVVIYDALTNKWSKGTNMSTPRSWAAAAVIEGKVYVAGGQGNTKFLDSAEVYDPESDTWEAIASMEVVRSSCQGVALDGQFWVIAGEYVRNHYDNNQTRSAEVYDVETDSWRCVPNMCLDDNKVMEPSVVVNGELVCVHQNSMMAYEKESNSWNKLACSNARFGFACESVGSNLYVIGGSRVYWKNHRRYNTPLNMVEICDLRVAQQSSPSRYWWMLGADMSPGQGIVSASTVAWL